LRRWQHHYKDLLEWCLEHAAITLGLFVLLVIVSLPMTFFIGRDFFPYVDSGQMKLHVNPPPGLRLEDSEQFFAAVEKEIRTQIPAERVELILDNIGLPNSGINLAFGGSSTISNSDGDIQIALKPGSKDTQKYTRILRDDLRKEVSGARRSSLRRRT
jgi:multidrug efflux pump subunit AcrB